jgi:hypothetical protein
VLSRTSKSIQRGPFRTTLFRRSRAVPGARRSWGSIVGLGLVLLGLVIAIQVASGAYSAEPGGNADEPSHVLGGLMVRDYIASGLSASPVAYAREYYSHYPKIAIGNWPPGFYLVEALWLIVFPTSTASLLMLVGAITATIGVLVFWIARPAVGFLPAPMAAILVLLIPPVPALAGMVMLDLPLTLVSTLALFFWIRFYQTGGWRDLAGFVLLTGTAVLTKGNGLFLVALPPLSILIGRRWSLLRDPRLWSAAGVVALLAGPWVWYFADTIRAGWESMEFSGAYVREATLFYLSQFWRSLGPVLVTMATIGLWSGLFRKRTRDLEGRGLWVSAVALVTAVLLIHLVIPSGVDARHLIPAYPALALLIAAGTQTVARWIAGAGVPDSLASAFTVAVVSGGFMLGSFHFPEKHFSGFTAAAASASSYERQGGSVSLVASDAIGEGVYIVQMSMLDPSRPSHTVWRASKLLSSATWAGREYALRANTEDEVLTLLEAAAIQTVVMDNTVVPRPDMVLLSRAIAEYPDQFTRRETLPLYREGVANPRGIDIFDFRPRASQNGFRPAIRQVPGLVGVEQSESTILVPDPSSRGSQ